MNRIPVAFLIALRNGFLAGMAMAVVLLFVPNKYKSEARILPADSRSSPTGSQMAAAAAAVGVSVPGQDSSDSAFVDIVESRWMAKKLLTGVYAIRTRSWYFGGPKEYQDSLFSFLHAKNNDEAIREMKKILKVKRDLKSKLLTITAETASPELSQQIVQKATQILENFVQVKSRTRGGNKAIFTAQRLVEAQAATEKAEQEFQNFINIHRNFMTSNEPSTRLRGARLEAAFKLRQQVVTTLTLNYEQSLLEEKNDMPILNILDEGDLADEKSWPKRSLFVFLATLLGALWRWIYINKTRIFN